MKQGSVICIGKFNGMHRGHQLLIHYVAKRAKREAYCSTMFTFLFEHAKEIYEENEKRKLARELGVEKYIACPFTDEVRQMSPEQFISDILVGEHQAKVIVVGEDFRFGYERSGDVALLEDLSEKYGYELKCFRKLSYGGAIVSSSRIKEFLLKGQMQQVNDLLGKPYFFCGTVVKGNQIGRTLQMPTANIMPGEKKLLPPSGVYASIVTVADKRYLGVTNIGKKPTIPGENKYGVETYLFDFDEDIYGQQICVELFEFLRPEKKFAGLEQLKENMLKDKEEAKRILSSKQG